MPADPLVPEPKDLYDLRQASHALLDALYDFEQCVIESANLGARFPLHEVAKLDPAQRLKWSKKVGFQKTYKELGITPPPKSRKRYVDPLAVLDGTIKRLMHVTSALIDAHGEFEKYFEALEEEFAQASGAICEFGGIAGRSLCKAMNEVVRAIVRAVFGGIDRFLPADEEDPNVGDAPHGFTPSTWFPTCLLLCERYPDLGIQEVAHDLVESEFDRVFATRLSDGRLDDGEGVSPRDHASTSVGELRTKSPPEGKVSALVVDFDTFTIHWRGEQKSFENKTKAMQLFILLAAIGKRPGRRVTFDELRAKDSVWDGDDVDDLTVEGAINRLKRWLRENELAEVAARISVGRVERLQHVVFRRVDNVEG